MPSPIRLKRGIGSPTALLDSEPALDQTVNAPKLFVGIGGVTVLLADPALVQSLLDRIIALEAKVVVLENSIWGIA